ncbi:SDR family oxidoreductase [Aspergillus stella-maris]|uniref:SDR family oxidoreductase n=1 Tax=Aspergillus stella-maris TaxID=1810926 RepID=UPI003CCCABFC
MEISVCAPPSARVAFVTGANGMGGQAIVDHLIRTPKHEWSQIIITSRNAPKTCWTDPRVRFIALDFLQEEREALIAKLKKRCRQVTHAFFTSYVHDSKPAKLPETNCPLFSNFLEAVDAACPRLQRVSLQTGGKHYGIQYRGFDFPCSEDTPRYQGPGAETLFYYQQEDTLFAVQQRTKRWHYNIIRPFGIVGFTNQFSGMNEALLIAQYFLICRELGHSAQWPGNYNGWHQVEGQSYAPSLADMHVWAATSEQACDQAFNHGNGDAIVWRFLWTLFGRYYGVEIEGPDSYAGADNQQPRFKMAEWARDKRAIWMRITEQYGGAADSFQDQGFAMLDGLFSPPTPGATFLTTTHKAREFGWGRIDDSHEAWISTFRSYENAGILPDPERFLEGDE